jgi:rare lipoprotein A
MRLLLGIVLAAMLSACTFGVPIGSHSGTRAPTSDGLPDAGGGGRDSYVVFGRRYFIMDSASGFVEKGIASWYGRKFHGRATASGEIYDMHAMTAAHKSLPLPTWVRVRNLDNGKSIVVKVNDRGPFVDDRIIDLSYEAAKRLDMIGPGTARVEVVALESPRVQAVAKQPSVRAVPLQTIESDREEIYIQMGSFSHEKNAINLRSELHENDEKPIVITRVDTVRGAFYRVLLGPLQGVDEAVSVQKRLKRKGYDLTRILFVED